MNSKKTVASSLLLLALSTFTFSPFFASLTGCRYPSAVSFANEPSEPVFGFCLPLIDAFLQTGRLWDVFALILEDTLL